MTVALRAYCRSHSINHNKFRVSDQSVSSISNHISCGNKVRHARVVFLKTWTRIEPLIISVNWFLGLRSSFLALSVPQMVSGDVLALVIVVNDSDSDGLPLSSAGLGLA